MFSAAVYVAGQRASISRPARVLACWQCVSKHRGLLKGSLCLAKTELC